MQHAFFSRHLLAVVVTIGTLASGLAASPALAASTPIDASGCVASAPAPSQTGDHFTSAGMLVDDSTGQVLSHLQVSNLYIDPRCV